MPSTAIADPGTQGPGETSGSSGFWALTVGSIGVVYGDIGTSPLYAMRQSIMEAVGRNAPVSESVVLGILSLIIWALLDMVAHKYVESLMGGE